MLPLESDGDTFKGCGDHWKGLSDVAWAAFADPANFGKDMEALLSKGATSGFLASGENNDGWCGPNASALEQRAKRGDTALVPYVARFGHFFSDDFLTRRMFETLNGENDPSLAGFRKACDVLWPLYAHDRRLSFASSSSDDAMEMDDGAASSNGCDVGQAAPATAAAASSLVEHVYDEYFTELDIGKVGDFMRWLGVYKHDTVVTTMVL